MNTATHQATVLNRRNHTYATPAYTAPGAGAAGQMRRPSKIPARPKSSPAIPARHYTLTHDQRFPARNDYSGRHLGRAGFAAAAAAGPGGGPFAAFQASSAKSRAIPLKTSLVVTGSPMGNTTVQSSVVSVSQAPLPASLFAVPAGYKKSQMERARGCRQGSGTDHRRRPVP